MWIYAIFGIILLWALISKIGEYLSKLNRRENSKKDGIRLSDCTVATNTGTTGTNSYSSSSGESRNVATLSNSKPDHYQQESVPFSVSNVGHYLLLDLSQRSDEWLKWRDNGIGASDAPTIMGETRWKTRDSLLREKVYGTPERKTATMIRGIELEPEALMAYQKHTGIKLRPVCIQSQYFPWLRASLDGLSYDGQRVVEIKCGESVYRHTSRYKQPPRYYYGQLQHILALTGLPSIDFWCYWPEQPYVHIIVYRDSDYIKRLLKEEKSFWDEVCDLRKKAYQ
jgi:putative phage-type endonuclease